MEEQQPQHFSAEEAFSEIVQEEFEKQIKPINGSLKTCI